MEEKVIVYQYAAKTSTQALLFLTLPRDNEVAYGYANDANLFVVNGWDMSKAHNELNSIMDDAFKGNLEMTETASDLLEQGILPVQARRNVSTGTLTF